MQTLTTKRNQALEIDIVLKKVICGLCSPGCDTCTSWDAPETPPSDSDFDGWFSSLHLCCFFAIRKNLLNCAQVSKMWSTEAIPILWRDYLELKDVINFVTNTPAKIWSKSDLKEVSIISNDSAYRKIYRNYSLDT